MAMKGEHGVESMGGRDLIMRTVHLEQMVAYVDGVSITEDLGRTWSVGSQEFLCTPQALELV
jgi:hypothetical protein